MKQAKHCIQEPHRPTVSLNQSETMLFNTDMKKTLWVMKPPPANIREALAALGAVIVSNSLPSKSGDGWAKSASC